MGKAFANLKQELTQDYQSLSTQLSRLEPCIDIKLQKELLRLLSALIGCTKQNMVGIHRELASLSHLIPYLNEINVLQKQIGKVSKDIQSISTTLDGLALTAANGCQTVAIQNIVKSELKAEKTELQQEIRALRKDVASFNDSLRQDLASVSASRLAADVQSQFNARLKIMEEKLDFLIKTSMHL